MTRIVSLLFFVFCLIFASPKLLSEELQKLHFGKIAISSNSQISTTSISRTGLQTFAHKIRVLEQGAPGIVMLENLPPYSTLTLSSITPVQSSHPPGSAFFILQSLDHPAQLRTNGAGVATLQYGGTLSTSGLGGVYLGPASYRFTVHFEVAY